LHPPNVYEYETTLHVRNLTFQLEWMRLIVDSLEDISETISCIL
jgi:hypothetical protein